MERRESEEATVRVKLMTVFDSSLEWSVNHVSTEINCLLDCMLVQSVLSLGKIINEVTWWGRPGAGCFLEEEYQYPECC